MSGNARWFAVGVVALVIAQGWAYGVWLAPEAHVGGDLARAMEATVQWLDGGSFPDSGVPLRDSGIDTGVGYYLLLAGPLSLSRDPRTIHWLVIAAMGLSLLLLAPIARRRLGSSLAVLALAWMASSQWFGVSARLPWHPGLLPATCAAWLLACERILDPSRTRQGIAFPALMAGMAALGPQLHPLGGLLVVLSAGVLWRARARLRRTTLLGAVGIGLVALTPLLWSLAVHWRWGQTPSVGTWGVVPRLWMSAFDLGWGAEEVPWPTGIGAVVLAAAGLGAYDVFEDSRRTDFDRLLVATAAVGLVGASLLARTAPGLSLHYLFVPAAPVSLLAFGALGRRVQGPFLLVAHVRRWVVVAGLAFLGCLFAWREVRPAPCGLMAQRAVAARAVQVAGGHTSLRDRVVGNACMVPGTGVWFLFDHALGPFVPSPTASPRAIVHGETVRLDPGGVRQSGVDTYVVESADGAYVDLVHGGGEGCVLVVGGAPQAVIERIDVRHSRYRTDRYRLPAGAEWVVRPQGCDDVLRLDVYPR